MNSAGRAAEVPVPRFALTIATWFGCGFFPFAPGTIGSLGAFPILFIHGWQPWYFALLALLFLPVAIWSADVAERWAGREDPHLVVVDEVLGQWITLAGATRLNWKSCVIGFVLFRLLDIWKPSPARQLERVHGGAGIVLDDCMAGIYGALVLFTLGWFNFY